MPNSRNTKEIPVNQLRWQCDPDNLGIKTTDDAKPSKEIIGQERAMRALRLGLEMKHPGYNVFVTGFSGTGRMTTIKRLLGEFQKKTVPLSDHCYVHNFRNSDQPLLITLPAGQGAKFRRAMEQLVQDLTKNIPAAFERKRFKEERKRTMEHFQERQHSVLKDFEAKVKEKGFEVVQVQVGPTVRPDITPVVNNQAVSFDQLDQLLKQGQITKEQLEQFTRDRGLLENQMEIVLRELRNIERKAKETLDQVSERFILPIVKDCVEDVRRKFDNPKLHHYLDDVQENIMSELGRFHPQEDQPGPALGIPGAQREEDTYLEYQVNVVVDNSGTKGVPIVIETNPKYRNVFGTVERVVDRNGVWRTDFTHIKPGSLLCADGGYLVINAVDALVEAGVWTNLKRMLRYCLLEIQPIETGLFGASSAFKPESIAIDVKVILLGDVTIYRLLYDQDDEFKKIFKVRADFDTEMPKNSQSVESYIAFIRMICGDERLLPFDATAVAAVIEYGVRLAGRQTKISTRFNLIADVVREANYWAKMEECRHVTGTHIRKAIDERVERVNLTEEKLHELITDGTILIDIEGTVIGQVNGLTVYDLHEHTFGIPARVTAKTSIGRQGVINIEREIQMSGPAHNKGIMIISGYLHGIYAQTKPLTVNASVTFEQSYGGVEGDSASSTEIYAILSSLANVPLRQDIAVTGSVNQKGEIQPIGGVNEKIEGFFRVCNQRGLNGSQGVIIPHQNKKDLMLRQEVVEAVGDGKFHVYAIKTIDEGLEILSGLKAGKRRKDGAFDEGSIHALVDATLTEYARYWRELID